MYVEVSGRQTGKTSRLIDSVIEFLTQNPHKTALIVGHNNGSRKDIQKKIHDKCGRPCEYRTITSHKMLPPTPSGTIKQFVDEFWLIPEKNLVIDQNAYYNASDGINHNEKAYQIWEFYKFNYKIFNPNYTLKRHNL
jgi:hypothetical protein